MEPTALARLRRLSIKQTTRVTHYGRKTGKPHKVTIWFVLDGDRLYIGTANVSRQWVRNVHKTPKISGIQSGLIPKTADPAFHPLGHKVRPHVFNHMRIVVTVREIVIERREAMLLAGRLHR